MREGGLDQSGGKSKGSKKWSDFEYILKEDFRKERGRKRKRCTRQVKALMAKSSGFYSGQNIDDQHSRKRLVCIPSNFWFIYIVLFLRDYIRSNPSPSP